MKSDKNGCSTCPIGGEQYEEYKEKDRVNGKLKNIKKVQYDYRHTNGKLFSCIAMTLEEARKRKSGWMIENGFL